MRILFLLFFGFFSACSANSIQTQETKAPSSANKNTESTDTSALSKESTEDKNTHSISHIVDGDTIYVIIDGREEKIRILGINTPEKDGGFKTAECFGDHASDYAKKFLQGKKVSVLQSKTGNSEDQYGRLLRYIFVDGKDFGAHLIEEGYAESYKKFPHDRRSYYNTLEKKAQKENKGMWNPENCEFWGQTG